MVLPKSFGVARNWPSAPGQVSAVVPAVIPTPTFLPATTSAASRAAVLSVAKLVSAYAGPLFDVVDATTGATVSIYPQAGGQFADTSTLDTSHSFTVTKLYDQTGNGWHHTVNTAAGDSAPLFVPASLSRVNSVRGKQSITFGPGEFGTAVQALTNTAYAAAVANSAVLHVMAPTASGKQALSSFGSATADAAQLNFDIDVISGSGFAFKNRTNSGAVLIPRCQPAVMSVSCGSSAANSALRTDGQGAQYGLSVNPGNNTVSRIGRAINTGDAAAKFQGEFYATILYGAPAAGSLPLPFADYTAERAVLETVFDIADPGVSTVANNIVLDGDSRVRGAGVVGGANLSRGLEAALAKRCTLTNIGISGQMLSQMNATAGRANVVAQKAANTGATKHILAVTGGINDIQNATWSDSATIANAAFATLQSYVTYMQGQGFTVLVGTVLKPASFPDNSAGRMAAVDAFNASVRSAYGSAVIDLAAIAALQNPASTTYWNADGLHENAAGQAREFPAWAAAINGVLA